MIKTKKTILIDIDGVLNNYSGIYEADYIPTIKEGALEFIKEVSKSFKIVLFTSRNLLSVSKWVIENNLNDFIEDVTNIKIPNFLIIDDRCIKFNGNYSELIDEINNFKVWYK